VVLTLCVGLFLVIFVVASLTIAAKWSFVLLLDYEYSAFSIWLEQWLKQGRPSSRTDCSTYFKVHILLWY
jgi:hypothetical protein